jgi:nitroreductase
MARTSTSTPMTAALGLSVDEVGEVLETASLAPSVHNSQPWRFLVRAEQIELHADHHSPVTGLARRELRLSCGAALMNMRLALQHFGIRPMVTLFPGSAAPGALAVVRHGGFTEPTPETAALLRAVPCRRTNRYPFGRSPVPESARLLLVRAAAQERGWLHVVSDREERAWLRELIKRADRLQQADPVHQAELAAWTCFREGSGDGVQHEPARGPRPRPEDEWVLRDFAAGENDARQAFEPDPFVVVVCSFYDDQVAELQAGQALQGVLLYAATAGLSASFIPQPVHVPSVRDDLRRLLGGTLIPHIVLRIGYGSPAPATPRRPVRELLLEPGPLTGSAHGVSSR